MTAQGRIFTSSDIKRVGVSASIDREISGGSEARLEVSYLNRTRYPIVIKSRLGLETYLDAAPNTFTGTEWIQVRFCWTMCSKAFRRASDNFKRDADMGDNLNNVIMRAIGDRYDSVKGDHAAQYMHWVEVKFSVQDILENGGSAYLEDFDVTISVDEKRQRSVVHPEDRNHRVARAMKSLIPNVTENTLVFAIKAVDNSRVPHYKDRFMSLGSQVFQIPIEMDTGLENGVHVWRRSSVKEYGDPLTYEMGLKRESFTFEEADKLFDLAGTVEAAEHAGDKINYYKSKLAEKTFERTMNELDRKEELSEVETQLSREKVDDARAKHHDELGREKVKSFADWMRAAMAVFTAAVSVFTVVSKLKAATT